MLRTAGDLVFVVKSPGDGKNTIPAMIIARLGDDYLIDCLGTLAALIINARRPQEAKYVENELYALDWYFIV
jgi:hypothetical protein